MGVQHTYYPAISTRQSEIRALKELAEPTKDRLFPIVRLQAWSRPKAGQGGPLERSLTHIKDALGIRPFALDVQVPRQLPTTEWAQLGIDEQSRLFAPSGGFANWCDIVETDERLIPTVIWADNHAALRTQVSRLAALGRGLVFRFRRSQGWNLADAASLLDLALGDGPVLFMFDCEQIGARDDLTAIGLSVRGAMLAVAGMFEPENSEFMLCGSSFPSQFAEINPEHAVIDIRERVLFQMLRASPLLLQAGVVLKYGDHASVFAGEREPAFRGAPRVDYPTRSRWVYHRCAQGFSTAVARVRADSRWDETLLCWGAQRIRRAHGGDLQGLNSQSPWVAMRINIHLHLQAHHDDGGALVIEEAWVD
ncbi:beta family protein [Aureimonas phyllosphaerae]|uniref:Beta protein n=1 Tax=Aureimonas phyllosphaerae TaxID=1166078 RepID=A0A7W6BUH1_9HYPH|nr:hypothetical protein [Aureimonas phyllosphaerae]MBB3938239.1 hypothetical protein [Aureimonas phyllosphaerae]MBB3962246.1 hypothetical protein [Aureimonas phyllosphaerae]SFF59727.1 Beta protein [Aureimonas phyllosphaerae]